MTPYREDLFDFDDTILSINMIIADGKKRRVLGKGTVKLTRTSSKHIRMLDVINIPGLDRRLEKLQTWTCGVSGARIRLKLWQKGRQSFRS